MSENKTVFERFDEMDAKLDKVLLDNQRLDEMDAKLDKAILGNQRLDEMDAIERKLDSVLAINNQKNQQSQQLNAQIEIRNFLANANKEYCWLGTKQDFAKDKKKAIVFTIILIGVLLLSTIFTSMAIGFYGTFTLFENIWLVMMFFVLYYLSKAKYFYNCFDFADASFYRFIIDENDTPRVQVIKKKYKVFARLAIICALINCIAVWMYNENNMALVATIFELFVVATTIYVFYFQAHGFFAGYNDLRYTGISNATKQKVVFFYSPNFNKLYTEENYYKQFPFYK